MRILLINHYAGSTRHGMEFRPFYMAREWTRAGHEVLVLAASYSHVRSVQPEFVGPMLDENIESIHYRWYSTPKYRGNGIGRVLNMLSFLRRVWSDARRIAREFHPDVVIASSTYPMDIWPARRIARLAGSKLVFEVHDLWPLSPMELGRMSKWHPFIQWVQIAEDAALRHADKVISMLPKTLDHMRSRGMAANKFAYVPNGVDESEWTETPLPLPADLQEWLDDVKASGIPIVGYAGSHGLANALDALLDAARQLSGKAQVLLVGEGPERKRLLDRAANEGLTNIAWFAPIPKRAIPTLLGSIDIAYIGLLPEPLFRFGISPNKLIDYMMAGKPVVMAIAAGNDPVAEAGCGISVPPNDTAAIAQAVLRLTKMTTEARASMGMAGRRFILENQTYRVLAKRFLDVIAKTGQP
jgi:glycosyltransferase involved in cell wall biosynthesis